MDEIHWIFHKKGAAMKNKIKKITFLKSEGLEVRSEDLGGRNLLVVAR